MFNLFTTNFIPGVDCSQAIEQGWWEVIEPKISAMSNFNMVKEGTHSLLERASYAAVLIENSLWFLGGYSFTVKSFIARYNFKGNFF